MKNVYDLLFYEKKIICPYKVFLNAQDHIFIGKGKKNLKDSLCVDGGLKVTLFIIKYQKQHSLTSVHTAERSQPQV